MWSFFISYPILFFSAFLLRNGKLSPPLFFFSTELLNVLYFCTVSFSSWNETFLLDLMKQISFHILLYRVRCSLFKRLAFIAITTEIFSAVKLSNYLSDNFSSINKKIILSTDRIFYKCCIDNKNDFSLTFLLIIVVKLDSTSTLIQLGDPLPSLDPKSNTRTENPVSESHNPESNVDAFGDRLLANLFTSSNTKLVCGLHSNQPTLSQQPKTVSLFLIVIYFSSNKCASIYSFPKHHFRYHVDVTRKLQVPEVSCLITGQIV